MVFNRLVAGLNFCTEVVFRRGLVENEELYVLKISFGKNDSTALQQPLIIPHWRIKTLSLSGVLQCIVASCSSITLPSSFLLWLSGIQASPAVRQTCEIPLDIPDVTIENVTTNRIGHIEITVKSTVEGTPCHRCGKMTTQFYGEDREIT